MALLPVILISLLRLILGELIRLLEDVEALEELEAVRTKSDEVGGDGGDTMC